MLDDASWLLPLAIATVLGLTATFATDASARSGTFGEIVSLEDDGVVQVLEDDGDVPDDWVWLDRDTEDDEDDYDGGQTVYLVTSRSRLNDNDIRVGSGQVSGEELDDDEALESLGGSLDYHDEDGDGEFDSGDGLYYDVSSDDGSGEISEDDLHVAGAGGSDGDDLDSYSGSFTFVDRDGDGEYGDGDDVYLDTDGDDLLTAADVGISGEHEGDVLDGEDEAVVHPLSTGDAPSEWAFVDGDGDGALDPDEAVFLAQSSSEVQVRDVRIANTLEGSSGDLIDDTRDDDVGEELDSLDGQLAYFDEDGDGTFAGSDTLYYDLDGSNAQRVSARDVQLSGSGAGGLVEAGDENVGNSLTSLDADVGLDDLDGDGDLSTEDAVYIDVDADEYVSVNDLELSDELGRVVVAGDHEAVQVTETGDAPGNLMLVDGDGDGRPDVDESLYLQTDTGDVAVSSLRVAYPRTGSLGSQVQVRDSDAGDSTVEVDGSLEYRDIDAEDAFDEDDILFYDLSDSRSGEVSIGDVVLSGSDAGTVVTSDHDELSRPTTSFAGEFAFLDADGDDRYEQGDGVVVDTDTDGFLSPGDVWFRGTETSPPDQPDRSGDDGDGSGDDPADGPSEPTTRTARVGEHFSVEADRTVRFVDNLPTGTAVLELTFAESCQGCSAHISRRSSPPEGTPPLPESWHAVGYRAITILDEADRPADQTVREGSYAFEVPGEDLPDAAEPSQIALLREADGWNALPTQLTSGASTEPLVYNASLPGLSAFAIAADQAPPNVTSPAPVGSTTDGRPIVSATWTDNREVDPTTVDLTIDGTLQTNATGTFETSSEGLSFTPETALAEGEHAVELGVSDTSNREASLSWTFRISDVTCSTPPRIGSVRPSPGAGNATGGDRVLVTVERGSCEIGDWALEIDGEEVPSAYADGRLTARLPDDLALNETVELTARVVDEGSNPAEETWTVRAAAERSPETGDEGAGRSIPSPGASWVLVVLAAGSIGRASARGAWSTSRR